MNFLASIIDLKNIFYVNFFLKIIFSGFLGLVFIVSCSLYSKIKFFINRDFIFIGFALPVIGFVITTVIGTNIALSLGMIGALSIIRFRTPVRSSYELVIYFALLTIGVATSVNFRYSIVFIFVLILFKFLYDLYSKFQISYLRNKINNKIDRGKISVNFSMIFKDNLLNEFISSIDYKNLSSEKLENGFLQTDFLVEFDNKKNLDNFLTENKDKIKSFQILENENN